MDNGVVVTIGAGWTMPPGYPNYSGTWIEVTGTEGMLVIGSSLSVYSGLRFCRYAVDQGRPLIILNQGQTRADNFCTRKFSDTPFALMAQSADAFLKNEQEPRHD